MNCNMHSLVLILSLHPISAYYFSSHGAFNNSCSVSACQTCNVGAYRLGCANATKGVCTNCTTPNAIFTSHGWFNDSCAFVCKEGFAGNPCTPHQFSFAASVTILNSTNQAFNLTTYTQTVACLSGCGLCRANKCGACTIQNEFKASIPVVYRRLLSSASVIDINTTVIGSKLASNINSVNMSRRSGCVPVDSIVSIGSIPTIPTVATLPSVTTIPTTTPPPSTTSNIGIVVGVVGGVVGISVISALAWYYTKPLPRVGTAFRRRRYPARFVYVRR